MVPGRLGNIFHQLTVYHRAKGIQNKHRPGQQPLQDSIIYPQTDPFTKLRCTKQGQRKDMR